MTPGGGFPAVANITTHATPGGEHHTGHLIRHRHPADHRRTRRVPLSGSRMTGTGAFLAWALILRRRRRPSPSSCRAVR
jgi:hypothetical protein